MVDSVITSDSGIGVTRIEKNKSNEQPDPRDATNDRPSTDCARYTESDAALAPKQDGSARETGGRGGEQAYSVRCRQEGEAAEPGSAQARRGEQKRQATTRRDPEGGGQPDRGQRHGASAPRELIGGSMRQICHDNALATVLDDPTVCSNYRRKPLLKVANMQQGGIPIGDLSQRTGCNVETIRYYERIGLLPLPDRHGRYRRYDARDIKRLLFVRRARELGFTLDEVRALLKLSESDGKSACSEVREISAAHLADVRRRIADLRTMERVLSGAIRQCDAERQPGCPLIEALSR